MHVEAAGGTGMTWFLGVMPCPCSLCFTPLQLHTCVNFYKSSAQMLATGVRRLLSCCCSRLQCRQRVSALSQAAPQNGHLTF